MKHTGSRRDAPAGGERAGSGDRVGPPENALPHVDSGELLGTTGRVVIEHRGQRYELRETRYGKLILTK
ncbi:MAG: hemin uptake protein HemP [Wenzhouxiangellaceae bacterium]